MQLQLSIIFRKITYMQSSNTSLNNLLVNQMKFGCCFWILNKMSLFKLHIILLYLFISNSYYNKLVIWTILTLPFLLTSIFSNSLSANGVSLKCIFFWSLNILRNILNSSKLDSWPGGKVFANCRIISFILCYSMVLLTSGSLEFGLFPI